MFTVHNKRERLKKYTYTIVKTPKKYENKTLCSVVVLEIQIYALQIIQPNSLDRSVKKIQVLNTFWFLHLVV